MVAFTEVTQRILWKYERELLTEEELKEQEKYREICPYNIGYKCIHLHLPTFGQKCTKETAEKCPYRPERSARDTFRRELLYGW